MSKIFHFVRHHEVPAYERIGWRRHDSLDDTHHGVWSSLMEWKGEGEPVKPLSCETYDKKLREIADIMGEKA